MKMHPGTCQGCPTNTANNWPGSNNKETNATIIVWRSVLMSLVVSVFSLPEDILPRARYNLQDILVPSSILCSQWILPRIRFFKDLFKEHHVPTLAYPSFCGECSDKLGEGEGRHGGCHPDLQGFPLYFFLIHFNSNSMSSRSTGFPS